MSEFLGNFKIGNWVLYFLWVSILCLIFFFIRLEIIECKLVLDCGLKLSCLV